MFWIGQARMQPSRQTHLPHLRVLLRRDAAGVRHQRRKGVDLVPLLGLGCRTNTRAKVSIDCHQPPSEGCNRAAVQWRRTATQGLQCLPLRAPEPGRHSPSCFIVAGLAPAARALLRISSRSCRFRLLTSFASASSADICGVRCTMLSHCKVHRCAVLAFYPQYCDTVT